jgi:hypothetical protein
VNPDARSSGRVPARFTCLVFEPPLTSPLDIRVKQLLGPAKLLWASPCSLVGLAFAAVTLLSGGKARWSAGALEVTYRERQVSCGELARKLPVRGIVFGHVILAVTDEELAIIGAHERVHVQQYERWGPLFFPAYVLSSVWQLIQGRSPYWHNGFEVQARALSTCAARPKVGAREKGR